jgi:hypothetical protein
MARPRKNLEEEARQLQKINAMTDSEKMRIFVEQTKKRLAETKRDIPTLDTTGRKKRESLQQQVRTCESILFQKERREILSERGTTETAFDFAGLIEKEVERKKAFYKKLAERNNAKYRAIAINNGVKIND